MKTTDTPSKVGARIRRRRLDLGLSQRDVAEPVMTPPYLSLIETGHRSASTRAIRHIAKRLSVDVDELLTGKPSGLDARLELALQEARGKANNGALPEAEEAVSEVFAAARRYHLPRLSGRALTMLASIRERVDTEEALKLFDDAIQLMSDEPAHVRFEAHVGLARCTHMLGDSRLAVHLLETYLLELKKSGVEDPTARMRVLSSLVQFYRALSLHARASETAEEAVRLSGDVEDPEQLACMNMNVARVLMETGRHDDAVDALRKAEQLYQLLEWPLPATRAKINRGIVQTSKGNLEAAQESFEAALIQLDAFPRERAVKGEVLNELGRVERLMGDLDSAVQHLTKARKFLDASDLVERALNAREMGLCLAPRDSKAAEKELRKAARSYVSAGASSEAAKTLLELGRLLKSQGQVAEAANVMEQGLDMAANAG